VDLHTPTSPIIGQLERSFSRNPHEVIEAAQNVVTGFRQEGLLSCLKHFPGHGLATGDSHLGLVDITDSVQIDELIPYKILIERRMADMIMTAHLYNGTLDDKLPTSLSPKAIKGLLRRQLGYEGVVISDDLHMGAIRQQFDQKKSILLALKAGNDVIILSHNPAASGGKAPPPDLNLPEKAVAWVQEGLMTGELDPQEIRESVERILNLKRKI
jgi:beta-N-acetylhexosaminidase